MTKAAAAYVWVSSLQVPGRRPQHQPYSLFSASSPEQLRASQQAMRIRCHSVGCHSIVQALHNT